MIDGDASKDVVLAAVLYTDAAGRIRAFSEGKVSASAGQSEDPTVSPARPIFPKLDDSAGGSPRTAQRPVAEEVAEQIRTVLAEAGLGTPNLQRDLAQGRVVIIQIAPSAYLGLTGLRKDARTLRIDDCLFLFAPPKLAQSRLAALVAELARLSGE